MSRVLPGPPYLCPWAPDFSRTGPSDWAGTNSIGHHSDFFHPGAEHYFYFGPEHCWGEVRWMTISMGIIGTSKIMRIKILSSYWSELGKRSNWQEGYLARMDSGSPVPRTMASKWVSSNVSMLERAVITSGDWNLEHCPRPAYARLYGRGERAKMRQLSWNLLRWHQFTHI